jgi:hypothetical protein
MSWISNTASWDPFELLELNPDSHSECGSRSETRREKRPTNIEKVKNFHVLKCWMLSFEGLRLLL